MGIGQTVYLRPNKMGSAYRRDKSVKTSTITKIGRKYVTVERYGEFEISSGRQKTNYCAEYTLYLDKTKLILQLEKEDLSSRIKNCIPKYGKWDIEIEKLRQIATILDC